MRRHGLAGVLYRCHCGALFDWVEGLEAHYRLEAQTVEVKPGLVTQLEGLEGGGWRRRIFDGEEWSDWAIFDELPVAVDAG